MSKNVQLQSEDSNVAPPLELDVLVHVEEEHEGEEEAGGGQHVPHLVRIVMNIWTTVMMRRMRRRGSLTSCQE